MDRVKKILPENRRDLFLLAGVSLASLLVYLVFSEAVHRIGFPLDDAWIHQTYARNLAFLHQWAFVAGQPSAGSTSPLWSGLLAFGYWLGLGPYWWAFLLGWLWLLLIAYFGMRLFEGLSMQQPFPAIFIGILLALEWHMVWAAGSGMETPLLAFIVLLVFHLLRQEEKNWWLIGALIGLSIWIRPDGVTLIGPAGMALLFRPVNQRRCILSAFQLGSGILILFVVYLFFNYEFAGAWWPNTYFAKQAEYAILRQQSLWTRILQEAMLPLVGAGAVVFPGFIIRLYTAIQEKEWNVMAIACWIGGYLFLYAWRLPVVYQHGRYIMPVIPAFLVLSLSGMAAWIEIASDRMVKRIISKTWIGALAATVLAFWVIGARAYAIDVAIIETEMVETAQWIAKNTEENALIAAHDIGALGYFSDRQILDLAGLVSPEVIPIIRDEERLAQFLDLRQAKYLITFPGWYPELIKRSSVIWTSGGKYSGLSGGENMAIYSWRK